MDDGHGPFEVPPLPPGAYRILTLAIDWEDGDPPVQPRWTIDLPAGRTRAVMLRERLVELEVG